MLSKMPKSFGSPDERLELGLNGRHRLGDEPGQVGAAHGGLLHDPVVASLLRQIERTARDVVCRKHSALGHLAACLVGFDLSVCGIEAVGRMSKKNHPEHRHEVIA